MRISFPALAAVLSIALAAPSFADDKMKADADALAALAIAKARANLPASIAKSKTIPYREAAKLAAKDGKPIFVVVGDLDCKPTCQSLRPDVLTCHELAFDGSNKPRAILCVPGQRESVYKWKEWDACPKPDTVRDEAKRAREKIGPMTSAELRQDMIAAVALGMIAIQPVEWAETQVTTTTTGTWRQVCEGGVCRWEFVADGAKALPVGDGPSIAFAPGSPQAHFAARFPRIAEFRGRLRGRLGMVAPRVAGGFVSYPQIFEPAPTANAATPAVVGGPILDRLLVRRALHAACTDALESGKLTSEQAATARQVLTDRNVGDLAATLAHVRAKAKFVAPVGGPIIDSLKAWLAANLATLLDTLLKLLMGLI